MRKLTLTLAVVALAVLSTGCAITDYSGFAGHQTQAEAKLWGSEISFITGDSDTGTYSYTVKYDNRGGQGTVTIYTYKNNVPSSFSRDGQIDRDGDDVQGSGGTAGGKFLTQFKAVDSTGGGSCEFFSNITYDKSDFGPGIALCMTTNEEVDKDLDLQAAFASVGDLLGQIWSGALGDSFTMEMNAVEINGAVVPVDSFSISTRANSVRPMAITVDLTQPAGASVIQAILDNTNHMEAVPVALHFEGGMRLAAPGGMQVAFNHDALLGYM